MKKLSILILLIVPLQTLSQGQIDDYLKLAAQNNPGLKAKFHEFRASLEAIPQAKSLDDPLLSFGYYIQPVETRVGAQRANLGLSQRFPWFGTLKAKTGVSCQLAEASLLAFEDAKSHLFQQVRVAYNELYYLHQAIRITNENLQLLGSFKELARVNFESGKTGFVNVLRVEIEEKELASQLSFMKDSYQAEFTAFEKLLNTKLDAQIEFPNELTLAPLEYHEISLKDSLKAKNLALKELQYQKLAVADQIKLTEAYSKPSFTVGLNYTFIEQRSDIDIRDNGKNAFLFPQVGMSIPLYQKKYQAMRSQVSLQKEKVGYDIENKTNELTTQLEYMVRDYLDGQRRIDLYRNLYDLSERSLSLLQTEFTTGKAEFVEVLRMERKLLSYQLGLERAKVDHNNAVFKINYLVGHEEFKN